MKNIDRITNDTSPKGVTEGKTVSNNSLYVVIPAIVMLLSYMTLLADMNIVARLANEDSFFEMLSVFMFFLAAILFVLVYFRSLRIGDRLSQGVLKRCSYLLMTLVLLVAVGEEASWGQRVMGVETPDYIKEVNVQDEINLHNLDIFQITPEHNILRLGWHVFWLMFALGLPAVSVFSSRGDRFLRRLVPVIPLAIGLLFLSNYVIWRIIYITTSVEIYLHFPEEIMESNIAILFFVTALWILRESFTLERNDSVEG